MNRIASDASSPVVVDSSAVVDALMRIVGGGAPGLPDASWHAPTLLDYEVLAVLRRHVLHGLLRANEAREALEAFRVLTIERAPADRLHRRVWALRSNFSAYDAAYVALAESLGLQLLTRDRRLARAAEEHTAVRVRVL